MGCGVGCRLASYWKLQSRTWYHPWAQVSSCQWTRNGLKTIQEYDQ